MDVGLLERWEVMLIFYICKQYQKCSSKCLNMRFIHMVPYMCKSTKIGLLQGSKLDASLGSTLSWIESPANMKYNARISCILDLLISKCSINLHIFGLKMIENNHPLLDWYRATFPLQDLQVTAVPTLTSPSPHSSRMPSAARTTSPPAAPQERCWLPARRRALGKLWGGRCSGVDLTWQNSEKWNLSKTYPKHI